MSSSKWNDPVYNAETKAGCLIGTMMVAVHLLGIAPLSNSYGKTREMVEQIESLVRNFKLDRVFRVSKYG